MLKSKTPKTLIKKMVTITSLAIYAFSAVGLLLVSSATAEEIDKKLISEQAYKAYQVGNYERALSLYNKIGEKMPAPVAELEFNKGAVRYRMGEFEDAAKDFDNALTSENQATTQNSHFNLGNTYFQGQQYDKAVEQYKEALKLDPADTDSKYNLELALHQLQEQEKKSKDDQDQDQDKDQEKDKDKEKEKDEQDKKDQQDKQDKQDENKDQEKQDEQKNKDDEKNQESQPDSTQSQNQQNQKQPNDPQQMSKEDAERLLNSLNDEELKQQQRKILLSSYRYGGKKW